MFKVVPLTVNNKLSILRIGKEAIGGRVSKLTFDFLTIYFPYIEIIATITETF